MDDNHPTNDYGAYVISSEIAMNLDEMRARLQLCLEDLFSGLQEVIDQVAINAAAAASNAVHDAARAVGVQLHRKVSKRDANRIEPGESR